MITAIALTCVGAAGYMIWDVYKGDGRKLRTLWRAGGLYNRDGDLPELKEKKRTKYGYCLRFSLPPGLSTRDFENRIEAIEQFLGHRVEVKYNNKNMFLEVYEVNLETYDYEPQDLKGLQYVIGYTYGKKLVTVDTKVEPHLLIAGQTNGGKSTALRAILTNLILTKQVRLHLIDLKRVELKMFSRCECVDSFAKTVDTACTVLAKVYLEVVRRYELFDENDCVDIAEYNKKIGYLPREVVVIDEFMLLRNCKGAIDSMIDLAATARACGIHLIACTQRPDKDLFDSKIKANFTGILGLKTASDVNSRIIIGENGLERVRGMGHGYLLYKGELTEVQTMNLQPDPAREMLRPFYVEQEEPEPEDTSGQVADFSWME